MIVPEPSGLCPRAVLWDMDGTILDTANLHWLAWDAVMTAIGYPMTYQQFIDTFGQRNDAILRGLLGPDVPKSEIDRIGHAKEERYRELVRTRGVEFLPGVEEWLRRLHNASWRQALASSAPRLNIEAVLEALRLQSFFHAVVSSEDVRQGKPDPQVYLLAAARVNVSPSRCIVVEDSPHGIEGARRAGMRSIAVGLGDGSSLGLSAADWAVGTMAELPEDAFERLLDLLPPRAPGAIIPGDDLPRVAQG